MRKAAMAAGGCAIALFAAVPLHVRLGNHDLPVGAATALQYGLAALGLAVALWISLAIGDRRRLPLAEGLVALVAAAVLNHVLLFDLVFEGVLDGGPAALATRTAGSYLATLLYVAAWAGAYVLLRRRTMAIGAMSVLVAAVASSTVVAQAMSRPRVTLLAESRPPAPDVFGLSGTLNILHLMPDSLQTDLVREVLEGKPALRDRLAGFRLYAGHVGAYPVTSPTLPTVFTGEYFDLSRGYHLDDVGPLFRERSFTNVLADAGFTVNVIGLSRAYCGAQYTNCVAANFGDLIPRGVLDADREEHINLARLLDLAALRVVPTLLVPTIYARGNWSLSRALRSLNGFGTVLDPFFHEWAGRLRVDAEAPPTYLFYHYIGTHPPAQWDAGCTFTGAMPLARGPLLAQTECVLQGIAELAAALKRANVLDRTVIIVNGDHGTVLAPPSVSVPLANPQVRVADLGQARPALLIKALGDTGPFRVTTEPTSQLDIRPTILGIAGLKDDGPGIDLMTEAVPDDRVRLYHVLYDSRWGGTDPVSHIRFAVGRDALNTEDWSVDAFVAPRVVPRTFGAFGTRDLTLLQAGAIALKAMDERGVWVAGRRLSVLLAPRDERDNALTVTLRLPEAHAGAGVTIRVNGVIADRHAVVASADARGWARAQTCLPGSTSPGAPEFVELRFPKTSIVAGVAVPVSALVRDIAFDRTPSCGGRPRK